MCRFGVAGLRRALEPHDGFGQVFLRADAAIIAAFIFLLHQVKDEGIAEPGLDVRAHPIGSDEGDDLQSLGLHVH